MLSFIDYIKEKNKENTCKAFENIKNKIEKNNSNEISSNYKENGEHKCYGSDIPDFPFK